MSDQGTDPAGPAGSTGTDESAQVTDVANEETVAVDGSAPSNGVRADSGTSAGTPDRTPPPNSIAPAAYGTTSVAEGTGAEPVASDGSGKAAGPTEAVATGPDDPAGPPEEVTARSTAATERPKPAGPRLQPQKPAVHTGRATVTVRAARPVRPDVPDIGTEPVSISREADTAASGQPARESTPTRPDARGRTPGAASPASASPASKSAAPPPASASPAPKPAASATTAPTPSPVAAPKSGPAAAPDGAQVTKAAVRPPAPETVDPKATPLRPVTSVPGVSGRAKVTVHRPATSDREDAKRRHEGTVGRGDAHNSDEATRDARATSAAAANAATPFAPAPTAPTAPASSPPARGAAARETAIRGAIGADETTREARGNAADDSPGAGVSERPGAVGRARVASTPRGNATAGPAQANAVAHESAGLKADRLAARAAAEKSAQESAERAARAQRVAQERAARERRERALAEQRVRDAAQAARQAGKTRPDERRTERLRAEATPAIDRQVTQPTETPADDVRAAATPGLDEKSKAKQIEAIETTEAAETTEIPDRTATDRPDSGPADGRTRAIGSDHRRRRRIATVTGAVVAVIVIAIVATVVIVKANNYSAAPPIAPAPKIDPPGPVLDGFNTSAALPTAAGLTAALARPMADKRLGSHVSVAVRDVATGRLLYSHGASSPTTPASSMKLATATAVLALRGPDYRITTRVVAGARPGEVVLVGAGDPTLAAGPRSTYPESGRLDVLADEVKRALGGVKPTRVVIDTTLFSGPANSTGWKDSDADSTYVHPIYALSTDGGRIDPSKTGNSKRYPNSALAAGQIFAKLLGLPATAVANGRAPRAASGASGTAPGAVLASVQSAPLVRILDTMLTNSDNVLAEFMARQVAIAAHRPASFAGAAAAVTAELAKLGLPTAGTRILDGSGVSHQDRLTPALLTALLSYDAQPDHARFHPIFSGLPIAGWSGTLADRFVAPTTNSAAGVLRAKTGTLDGVSALAGTVVDASGRSLAFAVMVDKVPIGLDAPSAEDAIGAALYRCGCAG